MITFSTAAGKSPYVRKIHATSIGRSSNSTVMSRLISNPSRDGNSTNCSSTNDNEGGSRGAGAGNSRFISSSASADFLSLRYPIPIFAGAAAGAGASRPPSRIPELDSERM